MQLNPSNFKHLFPTGASNQAPTPAPVGGSNWDSGLGGFSPDQLAFSPSANPASREGMLAIFSAGVSRDLAGANQQQKLQAELSRLTDGQLRSMQGLLDQAGTQAEQVFILKAFVAGEPWQNLVQFAGEMRGMPENEIIRRATMRDDSDVIQQWQDSCGPTLVQALAGEADPRFAWELNKAGDLARIDPVGANQLIANQQKEWLERYGGAAVQRGAAGGQGMALNQILDDMMGPLIGANYQTVEVDGSAQGKVNATERMAQTLEGGYDVPLRISWSQPGSTGDAGHFVLAMASRGAPGNREFQIHDPWTGKTAWIKQQDIARDSFAPTFGSFARLSHTYEAQPTQTALA